MPKTMITLTELNLGNNILGVITNCLSTCAKYSKSTPFCQFYNRIDKEQNWTFTVMSEALWKIYQYQ